LQASSEIKLIECPRDAMQGLHEFIPTKQKTDYINSLLRVGFDTLDFGSFVSPKSIPQLRDTSAVLRGLDLSNTQTKLLAIIANVRGAKEALAFDEIQYLGYPFSISEIFQKRNTNKTIAQSQRMLAEIMDLAISKNKQVVVYLSMGFGNPYREPWSVSIVENWTEKLANMGARIISLSDTIGTSNPDNINYLFSNLIKAFPQVEFGAHLHTTPDTWYEKIEAAYNSGCRRFDSAIKGFGGCPMADDDLVGNMPTEQLLSFVQEKKLETNINMLAFESAYNSALQTFPL
jgi:hydroxymethylglutaryl-CoA lyase